MGGDYNTVAAPALTAFTATGVDAGGGNDVMFPQLNLGSPPPAGSPVEYNHP